MSDSNSFFSALAGANAREASGFEAKAIKWRNYAKSLENDVATLKSQLAAAREQIIDANAKIEARNRLLERDTGLSGAEAIYAAFGGKETYEAAVQREIAERNKRMLGN